MTGRWIPSTCVKIRTEQDPKTKVAPRLVDYTVVAQATGGVRRWLVFRVLLKKTLSFPSFCALNLK